MRNITIGVDIRTFSYPDSISRGIGHYVLNHLEAITSILKDINFRFYGEILEVDTNTESLYKKENVSLSHVDSYYPDEVDLFHIGDPMNDSSGFDSPVRIFRHKNTTVTFHDLIPYHYYLDKWPETCKNTYLSRLNQLIVSKCCFLTNSEYTKIDMQQSLDIAEERIIPVMAGINNSSSFLRNSQEEQVVLNKYGIDKPFFLHVGAHDLHKNFMDAFKAFFEFKKTIAGAQFVVVGRMSGNLKDNALSIIELGFPDVVFTGFTERSELNVLYQNAVATLFLSSFEGFGFPILEAMSSSCPVITTNVTSIPEVAGNAAVLCDVHDIEAVVKAMLKIHSNKYERERLIKAGLVQSNKFSWEKTALKTIRCWEKMLNTKLLNII